MSFVVVQPAIGFEPPFPGFVSLEESFNELKTVADLMNCSVQLSDIAAITACYRSFYYFSVMSRTEIKNILSTRI